MSGYSNTEARSFKMTRRRKQYFLGSLIREMQMNWFTDFDSTSQVIIVFIKRDVFIPLIQGKEKGLTYVDRNVLERLEIHIF